MHSIVWIRLFGHLGNFTALCLIALEGLVLVRQRVVFYWGLFGTLASLRILHSWFNFDVGRKHKIN